TSIIQEPAPPLPEHVPAGLSAVIRRCLEKEPARRYQRASEVRAALEALEPTGALAKGVATQAPRRSLLWGLVTLVVLLLAGVGIDMAWRGGNRAKSPAAGAIAVPERVQLAILPAGGSVG